jgi:hypothetical protein
MGAIRLIYKCSACDAELPRSELIVKRVQFRGMGKEGRIARSRVVAWLCLPCVLRDHQWSQEGFVEAPGSKAKRSNAS